MNKMDSFSDKSETITNNNKLLKPKDNKHDKDNGPRRRLYIQMEYCERDTLRNFIEKGMTDKNEIWRFLEQILKALHYIHSMGLLHRDLKPANIFLDKEYNVKLGDFGLAQEITKQNKVPSLEQAENSKDPDAVSRYSNNFMKIDSNERMRIMKNNPSHLKSSKNPNKLSDLMMSMGIGTFYYMSPEQETQSNYNQKTDMFSLGIILFEM